MKLFRDILWRVFVASFCAWLIGVIMSFALDGDTAALIMIGAEIGGVLSSITMLLFKD